MDEILSKEQINKNNIFYEPNLKRDENYESIAVNQYKQDLSKEDKQDQIAKDSKDKIEAIKGLVNVMPEYIKNLSNEPLKVLDGIINALDDNDGEKISENNIQVDNNANINSDNDDYDEDGFPEDPFSSIVPDDIVIKYDSNDKVSVIKKEYNYDLVSIINDYINDISSLMCKTSYDLVSVLKDINPKEFSKLTDDYEINTAYIPPDFKHLSDLVNRSKIGRDTRTRMYNKLFNADKTINHIRICKAGAMQRIRYYEARYSNEEDYDIAVSNRILENSRFIYDNKYEQNFIALYKYLHSSVIVMSECISMFINELQAKAILKKEVDK